MSVSVPAGPRARRIGAACAAALPWILFALIAVNAAAHVAASSLCCGDDAFQAIVAKNLAHGAGYVASYHAGPHAPTATGEFAAAITCGPALILPTALAIRVAGAQYWVPGAACLLLTLALLAALVARLRAAGRTAVAGSLGAALLLVALQLVTVDHYEHWYALLGEIPALLLSALGLALVASPGVRHPRRDLALGALLLGLAFQTKTLALFVLPPALAFAALAGFRSGSAAGVPAGLQRRLAAALAAAATLLALFATPTLVFEAAKLTALGRAGYVASVRQLADHIAVTEGSGAALATGQVWTTIAGTARDNARIFAAAGRGPLAWGVPAAILVGLAAAARRPGNPAGSGNPGGRRAALALHAAAAIHFGWWFLLSSGGRMRYLLIGFGIACCAVAFELAEGEWSRRKALVLALFALALAPRFPLLAQVRPPAPWFAPSPRVESMLETARFLERERPGAWLASDWWAGAVDMEYLLAGSGSFLHVTELPARPDRDVLLLENGHFVDMAPGLRESWTKWLGRYGAVPVFASGRYRVYRGAAAPAPAAVGAPEAAPAASSEGGTR